MGPFLFILAFLTFVFLLWAFIIKPEEKRVEELQKKFEFIQDEFIKIINEQGKIKASEFIEENVDELIKMPKRFFNGRKFKKIREFFEKSGENYNENEFYDLLLKGRYRDTDIKKFAKLIEEAFIEDPSI